MEQQFWERFHPYVWSVTKRDLAWWEETGFVFGEDTKIHKFSYFYAGSGELEYNDSRTALAPGMLVYSSPGNWIQLTSTSRDPLCFYSVMFDYALVRWESGTVHCEHKGQREKSLPLGTIASVRPHSAIAEAVQHIHAHWAGKAVGYKHEVKLGFINLVAELARNQHAAKGDDASLELVNRALAFINEHYRETLDRKTLANHVSLSLSHFSLLFKKYTGCSPVQYVTKLRVEKAKESLRESRKSISVIAAEVGYGDPLYFSRVFAKETGRSPREYRGY